MQTNLPVRRAVSQIVRAYRKLQSRKGRLVPLRVFAVGLSDVLAPFGGSISHQTVKNWQDNVYLPNTFYMMQIAMHAPWDWRRDFAQDVLAVLQPDLYRPASDIGASALLDNGLGSANGRAA